MSAVGRRFEKKLGVRRTTLGKLLVIAGIAFGLIATVGAQERKFYPDDPLRLDRDSLDTPEPAEIELGDLYDRFGHIFGDVGSDAWTEAANANTLDEVPDSSWFTNRHGVERMSVEALVRGPDSGDGPDLSDPWTIFKSKSQGLTPGFEITDARGDRYIIKFDPLDIPELASAAENHLDKVVLRDRLPRAGKLHRARGPGAVRHRARHDARGRVRRRGGAHPPASRPPLEPRRPHERSPARDGQQVSVGATAGPVQVLRHAERRPERRDPARAPSRAARPAGVRRLAQSR